MLGYKTPFEIYFGRKYHSKQSAIEEVDVAAKASMYEPTDKDRRERRKNASVVRQQASDATKRCCERMIRCHGRSHPLHDITLVKRCT